MIRVLDALGVGDAVRQASQSLRVTEFRSLNGKSVAARFDAPLLD
jgi:hypothetical protein